MSIVSCNEYYTLSQKNKMNLCIQPIEQRIINDRIEKYESYIIFFSKEDCRNEECLSRREIDTKGNHRPHMHPTPGRAWGMGVVGGFARAVLNTDAIFAL